MGVSQSDYLTQLQQLLPPGIAFTRESDRTLTRLLSAFADELYRVDLRSLDLMIETDPRTTIEMLADWERVAGLPDPCALSAQTLEQRRSALVSKLTMTGGQTKQYFIDLAESLGYPGTTIDEFTPMTCNDDCNDELISETDRFCFRVNLVNSGGLFIMDCNSDCNSYLQSWGDEIIECRINRFKPSHTTAIFAYI